MVSLINKLNYNNYLADKPKLLNFYRYINRQALGIRNEEGWNESDRVYFNALQTIVSDDKEGFEKLYNGFSKRKPSRETVWIQNDIFLFVLIVGIIKYRFNKDWIREVLAVRPNENDVVRAVNKTFLNIVNEAFAHDDNIYSIVIVLLDVSNLSQLSDDLLNKEFRKLSQDITITESKNDFLIMTALRAYEIIIENKEAVNSAEVIALKEFSKTFKKRAEAFSWVICFLLISFVIYNAIRMLRSYAGFRDWVTDIGSFFQLLGVSLIVAINFIRKQIFRMVNLFFGYKGYTNEDVGTSKRL